MSADGDPESALDADELAGVVDLFGVLTESELREAASELAFKRNADVADAAFDDAVAAAVASYHLAVVGDAGDDGEETRYAVGPVAFPTLPPGAEDLPHILDVPERTVDRERVARGVEERLRADAARAVADRDDERIAHLLDATYDLEAWAPVDASTVRERLDAAGDAKND